MKKSSTEVEFQYSNEETVAKSPIARSFFESRDLANSSVEKSNNKLINRFYNLDHNAYLNGALSGKEKELLGLSVSTALRCEDCIHYHLIQCYRLGYERSQLEEALNVSLIIGGSIVVPVLRRAFLLLDELYS